MTQATRYQYEKRIKELEDRARKAESQLYDYKTICANIHNAICELGAEGKSVCRFWILRQFKGLWK